VTAPSTTAPARPQRFGYLAELWRRRDFAWYTALGNLRARHSNTFLGAVWWVLSPLLLGMVFLLVFGIILDTRKGDPNYVGYLLSGLFAFTFTRTVMTSGVQAMKTNAKLISTRQFPRLLLPITAVIEAAIGFLASIIPFFLIVGISSGQWPGTYSLILLPIFVLHVLFNVGLAVFFTVLVIPVPDLGNFMQFLSRIWLYTSPIIFPIDVRLKELSEFWFTVLSFNPMVSFLGVYRGALLGRDIDPVHWFGSIAWGVGLLVVGVYLFIRNETRLVRYLR